MIIIILLAKYTTMKNQLRVFYKHLKLNDFDSYFISKKCDNGINLNATFMPKPWNFFL